MGNTRPRKLNPREEQRGAATAGLHNLEQRSKSLKLTRSRAHDLLNHVTGFYAEVDKLAKGKALLEVTLRTLEETNLIISDAKSLISGDQYLDRTHQFVSAGDNPVYPDVVIALRTVQQSLERFIKRLDDELKTDSDVRAELNTIVAAIDLEDSVDEVTAEHLRRRLGRPPHTNWIFDDGFGSHTFDFEKLDEAGPPRVDLVQKSENGEKAEQ